jgi:DNA-binding MarR family transcriptional regulator
MSSLQEQILCEIGRGTNLSKSSIAKQLQKHYPDVNDAVKILLERKLIKQNGEHQGRGNPEKFYILTDDGIEQLIKFKIPLEDFWKLVFFVFDETIEHKLKRFTVNSLFSVYEKEVLMLQREHATPLYDWEIIYFQYLKRTGHLEPTIRVLLILAKNQPLSIKEILKKIQIPKSQHYQYYSSKPKNSTIINDMIKFLLVDKIDSKSKRYRLSHFGILLLLTELFDKNNIAREVLKNSDVKEITKAIIINYRDFFPLIFGNWNILSRILTEDELLRTFRMVINHEESLFSAEPLQNGGLYELFSILKSMRRSYQNKLEKLLETGKEVRNEWFKKNQKRHFSSRETMIMLNSLQHKTAKSTLPNSIDAILTKIVEIAMEATSYDLKAASDYEILDYQLNSIYKRKDVRYTLVNHITFLFYTLLIYQIRFRLDMLRHIVTFTKESTSTEDDINKITSNWTLFLNRNKGFVESYSKWITTIEKFESQNIDLVKKMSNFSIDSSNEQREQNLYFARKMLPKIKSRIVSRD